MQLYIVLLWLFVGAAGFASESDEAAIAKFHEFDLAFRIGEANAEEKAQNFLETLTRQTHPRAWIYFNALMETYGSGSSKFDVNIWLAEARKLSDPELTIYLLIVRLVVDESKGAQREIIVEHLKEGIAACQPWGNNFWCGRLYAEIANYMFGINDLGQGLDYAKKALARLETMQGIQRYYIYDTQAILANLLDRSGQSRQALNLMEQNFEWFFDQDYLGDAAVMANNIALKLMRDNDLDRKKIEYYLQRAHEIIKKFPNEELSTHVDYTQGTFFLRQGQFAEARTLLSRSYEKYRTLGMKVLAYDALIGKAKAEFELNLESELDQSLKHAEPMLEGSYSRESLLLLELKYQVARKKQDYLQALKFHEDLLSLWKKVQKDNDLKQKNRLSIELGLQVEEQKNELLLKKNELSALQLKSAERFKSFAVVISLFFIATAILLLVSFKQKKRIESSKKKIKRILNSIDQGLLTVGSLLQIGTDYSQKTLAILDTQEDIAGRNFEDVAFAHSSLSSETRSMMREIMQISLGEERLAWDLNAHHLISELEVGLLTKRLVNIRWIPIVDQKNYVNSILVALTDVSQERKLTKELQEKNQQLLGLPDKLREVLQSPQQSLNDYLNQTKDCLRQLEAHRDVISIRQVHTQKGLARTLGLRSISSALHDLESSIRDESFTAALANCQREVAESEAFVSILGQFSTTQGHQGLIWLPTILSPHLKTWISYASEHEIPLHSVTVKDEIIHWSKADLDLVEEVCVHAINNSLDHGFILPKRSGITVDNPEITIRAYRSNQWMMLEINDNGAGLNMKKLTEIANQRGIAVSDASSITDLVFMDEVSTAQCVSESSGRGIGLAAVKSRIEARKGSIHIRNRTDGHGAMLEAQWPAQAS
ncbi:MAG TPA: ATP-binding protein [Oligoflexus sp.]|uniref:ATP-binding protein n=1 Tax=Oligoflexus sp. TaxID=1971216 RepID=UPI002D3A6873|nr:ATP-binding protein [Oligoflexus sp.]HYX33370.1 ATP-binding protein [Oligoflexus sp.]